MELTRIPLRSEPEKITPFEQHVLMDAFHFFRSGMGFPNPPEPVTYLQYIFLLEAYKVYYETRVSSIHGEAFEKGMSQLDNMSRL